MKSLFFSVLMVLLSLGFSVAAADHFVDDEGSVHEADINTLADAGITFGCNPPANDRFCPRESVAREQMASFLVRALDLPAPDGDHFDDDGASVHEADINSLAEAGVTLGCNPPENDQFCPGDPVEREEMASFLVRALDIPPAGTDGFVDDDGSVHEDDINSLAEAGVTFGCNPPQNDRFCPGDAVEREEMASFLVRAFDLGDGEPPPPPGRPVVELGDTHEVGTALSWVGNAPGDGRLWVTTLDGRVLAGSPTDLHVVLDIRDRVTSGGEQGLLSMAFHPGYADNGRFFVSYTDNSGDTVIREYRQDDSGVVMVRDLLNLVQPYSNHNGGMISFGPDGYLFIGLGDGGSGGDPHGHGQNPDSLLGSILRIDIDGDAFPGDPDRNYEIPPGNDAPGDKPEIWAYGVRNPWRFWVDDVGDNVYVGDVGQGQWEEIDVLPVDAAPAQNLGWNIMEGSHCYESSSCDRSGLVLPVEEYDHGDGCSITGGPVYRGDVSALYGTYFYSDFCTGFLRSFELVDGDATGQREWLDSGLEGVSSFGVGPGGTTYATTTSGSLMEIVIREVTP
ncbi:MAG: hypothetical protein GEU79_16595 [Acidimicrobiia bacterium]|nr:hypothetical protein [Acidimicrobiia bacterium]